MSKLSSLGLAAAALVVAVFAATSSFAANAPAISPDARTAGVKAAPDLIKESGLPCDLSDARLMGSDPATKTMAYEIACKNSMGYVLLQKDKATTLEIYDCLRLTPAPGQKPSSLACLLPANQNAALGLQGWLGGHDCTVSGGRYIGTTTDNAKNLYEAACQNGSGYVVTEAASGVGSALVENCIAYDNAAGAVKCTLTTPQQHLAGTIAPLAAASGKCASVKGSRFVGAANDNTIFYEVSCADGKGYMLHTDAKGGLYEVIDCARAVGIGGGCTLTDTRKVETAQSGTYSDLAKKAGFNCTVSKYALIPGSDTTKDIVDLACSNRPDGGIGVFPAHGAPMVYDCIRSQVQGYACSLTPAAAAFPRLTEEIKALKKGKSGCVVSDAVPFAKAPDSDLVETACADGTPGYVMVFANGSSVATELDNCAEYAKAAGGGCQLASNKGR